MRAALLGAAAALLAVSAHAGGFSVPVTPPGITVEPALHISAMAAGMPATSTQGSFTDANGMALYVYAGDTTPGQSACVGDCATAWPALAAPADAKAVGDWSIVTRADGGKQWAFRGKPLYRSAKDSKPGDATGKGAEGGQWQLAMLPNTPDEVPTPAAIVVKYVPNAVGDVFVDHRGMTLYTFDGDAPGKSACADACARVWQPLKAAELAKPIGDWTVVMRDDGGRQWAFKGKPLYNYSGDGKPGDALGMLADAQWHPAALRSYFLPPAVSVRKNGSEMVLATADGMTLYARDKFRFSFGSYSVHEDPPATSAVGRSVGTAGCEGDCTQTWVPFKAPADAQPTGFWSIAMRSDGSRQWAYQGYPVYTNTHDKRPGDMLGRDLFDLTDGTNALVWRTVQP
jgi:predicted lipoprotein with Yx(FWY)xxD motif